MGCFLACFGASNDHSPRYGHRHRHRHGPLPGRHFNDVSPSVEPNQGEKCVVVRAESSGPCLKKDDFQKPKTLIEDSRVESRGQPSSGAWKKVRFDSNITTYGSVSADDIAVISPDGAEAAESGVVRDCVKPNNSVSASENGSASLVTRSYRYESYREGDDEDGELDCGRTDLKVGSGGEYDDIIDDYEESDCEESDDGSRCVGVCQEMQSITKVSRQYSGSGEINEPILDLTTPDVKKKTLGSGSRYVSSVLHPVENTAQWKSVKARGTSALKQQKENQSLQEEHCLSVGDDLSLKLPSFKSPANPDESKHGQEIAVDASLSNWLVSYEKTPNAKTKATGLEAYMSGTYASSQGSNSLRSEKDKSMAREDIQKLSASLTPKRSPSRNVDDTPIIGGFGAHWNCGSPVKDSGSASSFKGIPNTTSKYREDKRVNWHSTPFETRLDRALNKNTA